MGGHGSRLIKKGSDEVNAQTIWNEFLQKLRHDSFAENDFTNDMTQFLSSFLTGTAAQFRREKFINSTAKIFDGEHKKIIILSCPDGEYRFDFIVENEKWKLCFIECITLPLENINDFPYTSFTPLPEKESWIYAERNISKMVYFFCKLKNIFGFDEALLWFNDGAGEFLCAKSWVPFYKESKSFILFCGWIENRINGENVSVDIFTDNKCVIRFINHLWFKIYHTASHIKIQLTIDEYRKFFEHIWTDRAVQAGWNIAFDYDGNDTILTFLIRQAE